MSSAKPPFWQSFNSSQMLRFLLLFACGWVIVVLISYFYSVIAIFTTAGIFAALLNYPVQWLSRYLPRGGAIAAVFLVTAAIAIGLTTMLGLEVLNQGQGLINQISSAVQGQDLLPIRDALSNISLERVIESLQTGLISGLGIVQNIFSSVFLLIFLAVITLYMLVDGGKIWRGFLQWIPESSRDKFSTTFQKTFLGFLRGQLLLMLFLSTLTFIVFSLLGINYALIFALIVGVLDAIPGIGATLGVLAVALLILASQGWVVALKALVASIVLQQIQDNFLHPKVMGDALEISPVLLFLALFIGERIAGLLGVFLAIPIAGMIAAWLRSDTQASAGATGAAQQNRV